MSAAPPRLETRALCRSFDGRRVVEDVSLRLEPGQVTCLLGPSGCGKSTTLRMIAGVEQPESGTIAIDGQVVSGEGIEVAPEARGIGLMFQDFALFPHLTVAANVGFGLKGRPRAERETRVADLLARVDLTKFAEAYPHQLSGGEQQRVALARALAPQPRVMLMDEPFSGLDNRLRDEIRDETLAILKEEESAVLLVTHEPEEAMRMADEIALMREGRVVALGPPPELYNAPADLAALSFFSDVNVIPARVSGGRVETPFGAFDAAQLREGAHAEVAFRPQHLSLDFDRGGQGHSVTPDRGIAVRATVRRARLLGRESLVELTADGLPRTLRALIPGIFLPPPGTHFWLTVPRNRAYVFKQEEKSHG